MIFSLTFTGLSGCGQKKTELVNVSYDATREFYKEYNRLFEDYWYGKTGEKVEVIQSHGGSGKQALEVANGLGADELPPFPRNSLRDKRFQGALQQLF